MLSNQNNYSPSVRKRKAYFTAFRVFLSYYGLRLKSKIFGKKYYDKRINGLHKKNAERIKKRVQELEGLFIKFGQLISNLSNVLPEEFREPLAELQDHVQSKPYEQISKTIEEQLGKPISSLFDSFDKKPLAAASIGQVHRAVLDGEEVVVKVQHLNIERVAEADLEILQNLVKLHAYFMDMHGLDHTYKQVKQMIKEELDYHHEAKAMQKISDNLQKVPELRIKVPKVYEQLSTKKVLVSKYYDGSKISNSKQQKSWEIDQTDVAKRLVELYCKMILVDGYYHADPHPGNILINKNGELILLDFGAVGVLSETTKKAIPELIEALVKNDTEEIVLALRKMGFLGSDVDARKYVEQLVDIFKDFLKNEVELDGLNFQNIKLNSGLSSVFSLIKKVDLREVSNNIRIPKEYILLNRTVVLMMGNAFQLAPEMNTLDVIKPFIKKNVLDQGDSITNLVVSTFKNQITTAISLPNDLSKFLRRHNESRLEQELVGVKTLLQKLYYLGQQIFYTLLLGGLIYLVSTNMIDQQGYLKVLSYVFIGFLTLLLFRSIVKDIKS